MLAATLSPLVLVHDVRLNDGCKETQARSFFLNAYIAEEVASRFLNVEVEARWALGRRLGCGSAEQVWRTGRRPGVE